VNPQYLSAVGVNNNRAEYQYIHNGTPRILTAFEIKEKVEISIIVPRSLGATDAFLEIYDENVHQLISVITAEWCGIDEDRDVYNFNISKGNLGTGLYFIRPRLSVFGGILFGHKWAGAVYFDTNSNLNNLMQLSLCDFAYAEPKKIRGGVIYHIFVDRFRRGGEFEICQQ
jgi:hypothetical protein